MSELEMPWSNINAAYSRVRSRQYANYKVIAELIAKGMSATEACEQEGMPKSTYYRLKRLYAPITGEARLDGTPKSTAKKDEQRSLNDYEPCDADELIAESSELNIPELDENGVLPLCDNSVIAIDFDGVICENAWPDIGKARMVAVNEAKRRQASGAKLILWTCRSGELLSEAIGFCKALDLRFDAINENLPELTEKFGNNCRKVFADEYWDDKAKAI